MCKYSATSREQVIQRERRTLLLAGLMLGAGVLLAEWAISNRANALPWEQDCVDIGYIDPYHDAHGNACPLCHGQGINGCNYTHYQFREGYGGEYEQFWPSELPASSPSIFPVVFRGTGS